MSPQLFKHQITVNASAIDVRNHVNNLMYLQWCLDAAEGHWHAKATTAMQSHYVWYVLNHTIDYRASAFLGEQLEVHTWVTFAEGVKSERRYEIYRLDDQKLLVEAKTLWCLLDAKTVRPTKISEEIRTLFR